MLLTITIVSDAYYPIIDGVVRFVDHLAKAFVDEGHEVNLVVPSVKYTGLPKFDYSKRPDYEFVFLPTIPIKIKDYYICLPHPKIKSAIKESDLIVVNSLALTTAYTLFFNRFYKKPVVEFIHADEREILHYTAEIPPGLQAKAFEIMKKVTDKIDYFAVATNKFKQRAIDFGVKQEQIFRVPFGYTPRDVYDNNLNEFIERFGIEKNVTTILYLGRLSDEKNIGRIVEVMGKISKILPVQCLIAGSGYKLPWIKDYIKTNDYKITLLGKVQDSELNLTYSVADIFLSPSFHESLGFTIVEAMSYGTVPAVNGKYPEDALNTGNSLQFEDITNIDLMVEQIVELIEDEKRLVNMQKNARTSSEQFRWDKFRKIWINKAYEIIDEEN